MFNRPEVRLNETEEVHQFSLQLTLKGVQVSFNILKIWSVTSLNIQYQYFYLLLITFYSTFTTSQELLVTFICYMLHLTCYYLLVAR